MNYVISDCHGCFYTLEKLLEKVQKKDEDPHLIFVGDYVDRGLHSKKVVDLVIQLQSEGAVCLRGNHDDAIDFLVNEHCITNMEEFFPAGVEVNPLNVANWWIQNGLWSTIQSYIDIELTLKGSLDSIIKIFLAEMPENHRKFFNGLKMHWENDTHFACHAFLDPKKSLPRTLNFLPSSTMQDMLWSRFPANLIESGYSMAASYGQQVFAGIGGDPPVWDKIGVFGHTPMDYYGGIAPIKHGNLRLIDTGAYQNGYLCAFCIEQDDWLLQSTDSRDIAAKRS